MFCGSSGLHTSFWFGSPQIRNSQGKDSVSSSPLDLLVHYFLDRLHTYVRLGIEVELGKSSLLSLERFLYYRLETSPAVFVSADEEIFSNLFPCCSNQFSRRKLSVSSNKNPFDIPNRGDQELGIWRLSRLSHKKFSSSVHPKPLFVLDIFLNVSPLALVSYNSLE